MHINTTLNNTTYLLFNRLPKDKHFMILKHFKTNLNFVFLEKNVLFS